jgi:hypothetical protein
MRSREDPVTEDRAGVRRLRRLYRRQFADQIEAAAAGPPFTPSQLAFMRRVVQTRRGGVS